MTRRARRRLAGQVLAEVALVGVVTAALFPYLWMVMTSLKPLEEFFTYPIRWIPRVWTLNNYWAVATSRTFARAFANSLQVGLLVTAVSLLVSAPAAYGFVRFRFPGRAALKFSVLGFQFFPLVVFLVPFYLVMMRLRLLDTLYSLVLSHLVFAVPLSVWMLTGFFASIPDGIEDAALIDGCSRLAALLRIVLPLSLPGLIATGLYAFIQSWQEFLLASIFTASDASRTLPVALLFFMKEMTTDWAGLMAASILMSLPIVIPFAVLSRHFQRGLGAGGLKG